MGRKSIKDDKNVYQISREKVQMTRETAAEKLFLSSDRIGKIEMQNSKPHPDEVIAMARVYKNTMLCNYYCSHECEIGQAYVPEIKLKSVSQITLEILTNLNKMMTAKDRLVDIIVDENIDDDEADDFRKIMENLEHMSITIDALKLWVQHQMAEGKITKEDSN